MMTRYRAWIDGQGLQDVDPTVIITDIRESKPEESIITAGNAYRDGLRVLRRRREALSVTIRFMIREYDVLRRKSVLSRVLEWASDGWLTINDRPDQRLRVVVEDVPAVTSALKWTDELSITLTAYAMPYWQSVYAANAHASGTEGSTYLRAEGDMPCRLEVSAANTGSAALNALTIRAGNAYFAFEGLGLAPGKTLEISYDDEGMQTMTIGGVSVMGKRTAASADDLWLQAYQSNLITFTADQTASITFKARGLWR